MKNIYTNGQIFWVLSDDARVMRVSPDYVRRQVRRGWCLVEGASRCECGERQRLAA